MPSKPSIGIVGPGRLGRALAENLLRAGYAVNEVVFPNAQSLRNHRRKLSRELRIHATTIDQASFATDLIWFCVPDTQLKSVAQSLKSVTKWRDKVVFHSSGAITSNALQSLRMRGASVASVHPLMTFVHDVQPDLANVPFALEGDPRALRMARRIIRKLGGDAFVVKKQDKVLYHAWGTLLSPLLLSFMVAAEHVARATGISARDARKRMLPIAKQTLSNYIAVGPESAFSGPLVRGDVAVVREHMKALKRVSEARAVYIASAKSALRHLPVRNRKQLEKVLRAR
jgi:predicted short-subunit dehydrogenase-like oxidoreductase (DUF2520 family)